MSDAAPALSEDDFLEIGLQTAKVFGWRKCKRETNIDRFKRFYLLTPRSCSDVWNELRLENLITKKDKPTKFLLVLRFLFLYDSEKNLGHFFGIRDKKTVGKYSRIWIGKLNKLFKKKVRK